MHNFPAPLSRIESDALLDRCEQLFDERRLGMWATILRSPEAGEEPLAGCVGLWVVREGLSFAPAIELAWRLFPQYWGRGIATEAARASAAYGFDALGLDELVAYTAAANAPSRRVMERLCMRRDPAEDFLHPAIAPGHRLSQHVLYRLPAPGRS